MRRAEPAAPCLRMLDPTRTTQWNRDRARLPIPATLMLAVAAAAAQSAELAASARQHEMAARGADMPGLAPLRAAPRSAVRLDCRELPDGGEITFQTGEPGPVGAIHAWFDAQVSDHGRDAMTGHAHSMMGGSH